MTSNKPAPFFLLSRESAVASEISQLATLRDVNSVIAKVLEKIDDNGDLPLLKPKQVQELLGIGHTTLVKLATAGKLAPRRVGVGRGIYRYSLGDLLRYSRECKVPDCHFNTASDGRLRSQKHPPKVSQ